MYNQIRQGDVFITAINGIPDNVKPAAKDEHGGVTLAYGEITGHGHRISREFARSVKFLQAAEGDRRFLRVTAPVSLRHEEHKTICALCPQEPGVRATHYLGDIVGLEKDKYRCGDHASGNAKLLADPGDTVIPKGDYSISIHGEYRPGKLPSNVAD